MTHVIEVIGLTDAGWTQLGDAERRAVMEARVLIGARRHFDLVPTVAGQQRHRWPSPLRQGLPALLEKVRAELGGVVVLASGDPLRSGVGSTLIGLLGADQVRISPALSSSALARARMGWSAEDVEVISLVGRSPQRVRRQLSPGARLVVFCSDGDGPASLAGLLTEEGLGASMITAWWHLGGPEEGCRTAPAAQWGAVTTPNLVLACVQVAGEAAVRTGVGPVPGRSEDLFDNDGQISKQDVRAIALARLRPCAGAPLWDLGAGSGAVGIEWALSTPRATSYCIERDPLRAARIRRNADAFGVGDEVSVVEADVDDLADLDLPDPQAVFVGGGLSDGLLSAVWSRLPVGGRAVAHAVTLESEQLLWVAAGRFGGTLHRVSIEHAKPLGRFTSWTPARPIVSWHAVKEAP